MGNEVQKAMSSPFFEREFFTFPGACVQRFFQTFKWPLRVTSYT